MGVRLLETMGAQHVSTYNRQLHTDEIQALDTKAEELAANSDKTADEWRQILGQEALRQVDAQKARELEANPEALAILQSITGHGNGFVDILGNQIKFLSEDNQFNNPSLYASKIYENRSFYDVVLNDFAPEGYENLQGVLPGSTLAIASVLENEKYYYITGGVLGSVSPDQPEEQQIPRTLELLKTAESLYQVRQEIQAEKVRLQGLVDSGNLTASETTQTQAQLASLFILQDGLDSTSGSISSGLNNLALSGANKARGRFIADNAKALGALLYDSALQIVGDDDATLRNQKRVEGLAYLVTHMDELPGELKESLKQSVSEANARFEAGDYESGGEILGELQANIYSTAGGTGGLVALGATGGAKAVKAIKSVDRRGGRHYPYCCAKYLRIGSREQQQVGLCRGFCGYRDYRYPNSFGQCVCLCQCIGPQCR